MILSANKIQFKLISANFYPFNWRSYRKFLAFFFYFFKNLGNKVAYLHFVLFLAHVNICKNCLPDTWAGNRQNKIAQLQMYRFWKVEPIPDILTVSALEKDKNSRMQVGLNFFLFYLKMEKQWKKKTRTSFNTKKKTCGLGEILLRIENTRYQQWDHSWWCQERRTGKH